MGAWGLLQVVFDIFAALGFFVIIMRMSRAPKDDPRLSRGLQLLQSKIAVLEDLSDRTEVQVNQLITLLDQKAKEIQAKIQLADSSVQAIKVSMQNSLEVAKIFQDKIPHQEIIERQNSIKYVQAARLAHQGLTADDIATKVDLPKGEIEFIAKVNRDQLMFNEESLPEWAKDSADAPVADSNIEAIVAASVASSVTSEFTSEDSPTRQPMTSPQESYTETSVTSDSSGMAQEQEQSVMPDAQLGHLSFAESEVDQGTRLRAEIELAERQRLVEHLSRLQFEMQNLDMQLARETSSRNFNIAFETPRVNSDALHKLGEEFRKACESVNEKRPLLPPLEQLTSMMPQIFAANDSPVEKAAAMTARPAAPQPAAQAEPVHIVSQTPQNPNSPPVIRKVVFPRIEATDLT